MLRVFDPLKHEENWALTLEKEVKLLTAENERLLRANQALQRHQKYVADNLNVTTSPSKEADQREFVIRKRQRE